MLIFKNLLGAVTTAYGLALTLYFVARVFVPTMDGLELIGDFLPWEILGSLILLALNLLLGCWWRVVLLLPATVAGVTLYAPYFLPRTPAPHAAPMLRVATFNLSCGNTQLAKVEEWLRELPADVVLLQELPKAYAVDGIPALTDVYRYQLREPPQLRSCGNMMLSRHPILDSRYIRLDDAIAAYWLQHATVDMNGRALSFYNVHLIKPLHSRSPRSEASAVLWMPVHYDQTTRDRQIERLLKILAAEKRPFVVAGDFNMTDRSEIYRRVATQLQDAFRTAGAGIGATWPVRSRATPLGWLPPLLRIDYIWDSRDLAVRTAAVGPELGSDHLPVYATFTAR
jgi:vancomycin resistance protein VanJ